MQNWTSAPFKNFVLIGLLAIGLVNCSHDEKKPAASGEIPSEVSLSEDRAKFAELRKDIPPEKQTENDRLAQMLKRWQEVKMNPDDMREKFENELRKSRVQFEKRITKRREEFNNQIKEEREKFRDKQKEDRDDFKGHRVSSEKRQDFYSKQDDERKKFDRDISDRRSDFDDAIKEDRKSYDDMVQNLRSEWRSEFPAYQRKYKEYIQAKKAKEGVGEQPREIPSVAAQLMNMENTSPPDANEPMAPSNSVSAAPVQARAKPSPPSGAPTSDLSEFDDIPGRGRKKVQSGGQ